MSSSDKGGSHKKSSSSPFDIFMKNKDDCDRPACEETVSALSQALNRLKEKENKKDSVVIGGNSSIGYEKACPPSKDQIGTSSWTLLHSMVSFMSCTS